MRYEKNIMPSEETLKFFAGLECDLYKASEKLSVYGDRELSVLCKTLECELIDYIDRTRRAKLKKGKK